MDAPQFYIPQRALAVFAHCDDIDFGCSGTIARWVEGGAHVTYCIVTDSGAGSNDPQADLSALVEVRQAEQRASARAVGVEDVRFFEGYRDGYLEPTLSLRREIARLIRQTRPNIVMTFDPELIITENYINHPDHHAVALATTHAVFPSAGTRPIFPELLAEGLEPHNVNDVYFVLSHRNNLVVDISAVMDKKLDALRCHATQISEPTLTFVQEWNANDGKEQGYAYAETFRVVHLQDAPTPE
ncbi:MAG: PIG-L deacetylase family protein [Phototrophicaceae bacterium]